MDGDLIVALLGRSFAQATLGNVDGAITDLTQALELEPDNADMIALRGDRYAEMADFESAAADYSSAMDIAGRTPAMLVRYLFVRSQGNGSVPGSGAPATAQPRLRDSPSSSRPTPSAACEIQPPPRIGKHPCAG